MAKETLEQIPTWISQVKAEIKNTFLPPAGAEEAVRSVRRYGDNPDAGNPGFQRAVNNLKQVATGVSGRL